MPEPNSIVQKTERRVRLAQGSRVPREAFRGVGRIGNRQEAVLDAPTGAPLTVGSVALKELEARLGAPVLAPVAFERNHVLGERSVLAAKARARAWKHLRQNRVSDPPQHFY